MEVDAREYNRLVRAYEEARVELIDLDRLREFQLRDLKQVILTRLKNKLVTTQNITDIVNYINELEKEPCETFYEDKSE